MGEETILLHSCCPSGMLLDQVSQKSDHLLAWKSDLLSRVELTESDSVILESALIDSHREGDTALVSASIPFTNGVRAIVNFA